MRLFPHRQLALTQAQFTEVSSSDKQKGGMEVSKMRATTILNGYVDWPGVAQCSIVEREVRTKGEKPSYEKAYAITSTPSHCWTFGNQ